MTILITINQAIGICIIIGVLFILIFMFIALRGFANYFKKQDPNTGEFIEGKIGTSKFRYRR